MIEDENVVVVIAQAPIAGAYASVSSVNSKIGDVILEASDVNAAEASHTHTLSEISNAGTAAAAASTDFATASQGGLAESAVQPGDLGAAATSNDYEDLDNLPDIVSEADIDNKDNLVKGAAVAFAIALG